MLYNNFFCATRGLLSCLIMTILFFAWPTEGEVTPASDFLVAGEEGDNLMIEVKASSPAGLGEAGTGEAAARPLNPAGPVEEEREEVGKIEELPKISNLFIDTDLRQVLQDIGAEAGINIITEPGVGGIVSAELEEMPLDQALDLVLAGTGFEVARIDNYYLVYESDEAGTAFYDISDTRVIKMNNIKADRALRLLPNKLGSFVRADSDNNFMVITAPPRFMNRIIEDLGKIDRPRRHVMLEARVVVMERRRALDLGVDWSFPGIQAGTFTSSELYDQRGAGSETLWPWGIRIGYTPGREFTNALNLTLNLMAQNDEASIIANPQLLVQDAESAEVRVTTEEYFEITSEGVTYARSQLEVIETGTVLDIVPRIGDNGKITLQMKVEVSDVVARGEANLPVVNRRITNTTVQVESGGTAAVAGLLDTRTSEAERRVPGVGRVPFLGRLFSTDRKDHKESQIAVFITATLLEDNDEQFRMGGMTPQSELRIEQEEEFRKLLLNQLNQGN